MKTINLQEKAWSPAEFKQKLMEMGGRYHIHHPYHLAMNRGEMSKEQIQGWVANRFYYQLTIPMKDAAILANCPERAIRRIWIQRILDHDGRDQDPGGIEAWLKLGEACGLAREEMLSQKFVLPSVKFAVDAYLNFARHAPWQEAACSSLTELFAPKIHRTRLENWPRHYPWIEKQGFEYFQKRLQEASRDVEHGLEITLAYFNTPELQKRAFEILQFKLDVLWSMLDAMYLRYCLNFPLSQEGTGASHEG